MTQATSTWEKFSKPATATSGDDFPPRPYVRPGTYHALTVAVGEPYDKANFQGEMQTKFAVEFELSGPRLKGETPHIPSFISLPPKFIDEGFLSEKSNLYKLLKAFGTDMGDAFDVFPEMWVEEERACDVVVEDGENPGPDGNKQSWITKFLPCSCDEDEAPAPKRPAAAGRTAKPGDWD